MIVLSTFLLILLLLIIIAGLIGIYYVNIYNDFQSLIIRINEVESYIDNSIRDKFDNLSKSINVIKGNTDIKEELFPEIVKMRSRKFSSFELNRKLVDPMNEFYKIKEEHKELLKSESFVEIDKSLTEIEDNLTYYEEYYNSNITEYNKLVRTFPSNLIAMVNRYKQKPFFDGKDMTDDDVNDFKL